VSYVDEVLAKFQGVTRVAGGWLARCPCPSHGGDGDQEPSLRVGVGNGGTVILHCPVGCSFWDVISAAGLRPYELKPSLYAYEEPHPPTVSQAPTVDESPADLVELVDRVYRELLRLLPRHPEHSRDLSARGLPKGEQDLRGYRSLRQSDLPPVLVEMYRRFGDSLFQVPGFVEDGPRVSLRPNASGLLVPVVDLDQRVVALKVRQSQDPKYLYVSSVPTGRSPGTPVHAPRPPLGLVDLSLVRVTEGELKADVATYKSQVYTLGVPGVSNWYKAVSVLERLGAQKVLVSFDWRDVRLRTPVAECALGLVRSLKSKGFEVGIETWAQEHKGVDDALAEGLELTQVWGDAEAFLLAQPSLSQGPGGPRAEWAPKPFPVDAFPAPVAEFVDSVSRALPAPADFVAVPALAVAGSMVGGAYRLRVKEGWSEGANVYAAIVGPPGSIKTPSLMAAMAPVFELQTQLAAAYHADLKLWREEQVVHRAQESAYRSALRKFLQACPGSSPEQCDVSPPPPLRPEPKEAQVVTDDFTLESLAPMLLTSKSILSWSDELTGKMAAMNAYRGGKGDDRQKYLSLWSGTTIKVDRKSVKGSVTVERPCFSIVGGIQPDLLGVLEDQKGRSDGFVDRLLFAYPRAPSVPELTDPGVPQAVRDKWVAICRALWAREGEKVVENGVEVTRPWLLDFDHAAKELFKEWHRAHKKEAESPDFPGSFLGYWSKLKAYMVRLTLIVHLLRRACSDAGLCDCPPPDLVDEESVRRAWRLIDYFKDHYRGVWERFVYDSEGWRVEDFLKWCRENGGTATVTDVYRDPRWRIKTRSEAKRFLESLADRGHGYVSREGKTTRFFLAKVED
jgi:hypothetical protein